MSKRKSRKSKKNTNSISSNAGTITLDMFKSSVDINTSTAMKIETVFTCISLKSAAVGQLPLRMHSRKANGAIERVESGRLHKIFTQRPCDYLSMSEFLEMGTASLDRNGVFYAYIVRNDLKNVCEIIPFYNQRSVSPMMDTNGNVYYTYVTNDGKIVTSYSSSDLMVIRRTTFDGVNPISPIMQNAMALGIAVAQDSSYKDLQEFGITSQMALKTDNVFKDPASIDRLREDWGSEGRFRGRNGVKEVPIFENGLTPISLKLTPAEADLLNNRTFTTNRICRMFNVPIELAGIAGTSKSGMKLDEVNQMFMCYGINPYLVKFEYALNALLPRDTKVVFNRKAFYAGSPWVMAEGIAKELTSHLATVNECRIDLGRDPVEGGDVFITNSNNHEFGTWDNYTPTGNKTDKDDKDNA